MKEAVRGMSADVKFTSDGFCTYSGRISGQTGHVEAPMMMADKFELQVLVGVDLIVFLPVSPQ